MKQLNKVTNKEVMDAIQYLHTEGFINNMRSDEAYYTKILLRKVANDFNVKLVVEVPHEKHKGLTIPL
tara:strand:- start:208 stop:411 length:204 start_codon:yes stop_codon:yes gene_type:complete